MSEPLGTCQNAPCCYCGAVSPTPGPNLSGPHHANNCIGYWPELPPSIGPATDQLNQQIRDVTSGKKEIVIKKGGL